MGVTYQVCKLRNVGGLTYQMFIIRDIDGCGLSKV